MYSNRREQRRADRQAARDARQAGRRHNPAVQTLTGLFVVVLGLLFLSDNLGWFDFRFNLHILPMLLVFAGILKVMQSRSTQCLLLGGTLILFGALFALRGLGLLFISWRLLWPLVLIAVGFRVILRAIAAQDMRSRALGQASVNAPGTGSSEKSSLSQIYRDDYINVDAFMGSYQRRLSTQAFRGGEINVIMAGCELDLRQCGLQPSGEAVLNVFSIFGGIHIKVPPDWTVILQGTPLMGGFEEKTIVPVDASKRLVVRGYAIMGGLEVRN